jgi:hypothetical protein
MSTLTEDIAAFIQTHSMTERQFGELALNDKNLVPQMRGDNGQRPRRLWPETEAKVRRFMATYRPQADRPQSDAA